MSRRAGSTVISGHLPELDSIRGLAALAVLLEHTISSFSWSFDTAWVNWPLLNALFDGSGAVTIFFVLSGFVLTRPYVASGTGTARRLALAGFYVRRVTRVWLPWLAVFALSLIVRNCFFSPQVHDELPITKWLANFWRVDNSWLDILKQCLFMEEDLEYAPVKMLPQDWSLAVEMKASLLIPLFILLVRRGPWLLVACGICLMVVFETGQNYFSFVVGVLLASFAEPILQRLRAFNRAQLLLFALAGLATYECRLVLSHYLYVHFPVSDMIWTLTSLGSAALIALSLRSSLLGRVLRSRPFLLLGRISYSLYLVQMLVLIWLVPIAVRALNERGWPDPLLMFGTILLLSISLTVSLAWALNRWVENPCVAIGKWASARLDRRFEARAPMLVAGP